MSVATDLEKLADLRRIGARTQSEFDKAKARLLEERPPFNPKKIDPAMYLARYSHRENADDVADAVYTKFRHEELVKGIIGTVLMLIALAIFLPLLLPH